MEIWLPCLPGYSASDHGRIRRDHISRWQDGEIIRSKAIPELILKPASNRGYRHVVVKGKHHYVHRLVLSAHIGECPPGHETNHKDGNKSNNRLDNLEWVTKSQNHRHRVDILHRIGNRACGGDVSTARLTEDQVRDIRDKYVPYHITAETLAREYGVHPRTIEAVISRKTWRHI